MKIARILLSQVQISLDPRRKIQHSLNARRGEKIREKRRKNSVKGRIEYKMYGATRFS